MSVDKGLHYIFHLTHQCLRLLGIWPDPHTSLSNFRRPKLKFIIAVFFVSFYMVVPQFTNVIHSWGNLAILVTNFVPMNVGFLAVCKLIVTRYHGETLRTLLASVLDNWTISKQTWERDIMLKIANQGRNLSLKCYITTTITLMFYVFFNVERFYGTFYQSKRKLMFPFNYPYNSRISPNFEITYIIQITTGTSTGLINSCVDSFVSTLLLQVTAQLITLRVTLIKLVEKLTDKSISSLTFRKSLLAIVERHQNLIRNAETIDNCYSVTLFIHMVSTTFQLCFETFQAFVIVTGKNVHIPITRIVFLLLYVWYMLIHLWFYCYAADKLMAESVGLGYGVYECNWYNLSSKDTKDLIFIARRSMIPLRLTAGKFAVFSLEMFGTTVKSSMGYLSVLLTINDKK